MYSLCQMTVKSFTYSLKWFFTQEKIGGSSTFYLVFQLSAYDSIFVCYPYTFRSYMHTWGYNLFPVVPPRSSPSPRVWKDVKKTNRAPPEIFSITLIFIKYTIILLAYIMYRTSYASRNHFYRFSRKTFGNFLMFRKHFPVWQPPENFLSCMSDLVYAGTLFIAPHCE